jgi:hypothetical protein
MLDPDRRPTPFQWRVLNLVRAYEPMTAAQLRPHFQQHGAEAIRSACWILSRGGYLERTGGQLHTTSAGRLVLKLHERCAPKTRRWQALLALFKWGPRYQPMDDGSADGHQLVGETGPANS